MKITINNKVFLWIELREKLDELVSKISNNDLEKKQIIYQKLGDKIKKINKNNDIKLEKILKIVNYSLNITNSEIEKEYKKIKKITLWYSKNRLPIYWYYKWNLNKWFFWIFSNIHWWYEYWTYKTAKYLIEEFDKSWTTWWFIIPTINPEWLEYYKNNNYKYTAYIKWRVNINNVDLNRNFCTKNYKLKTFIKNWINIKTWIDWCNSEDETIAIVNTLEKYKFNKIISLHSEWNILFIPDNSINDKKIIDFWYQISKILPNYKFDISYKNNYTKNQKIKEYEINEWWTADYTWTMENYIYENYNIPTILIEFPEHWKIEYKLKNLIYILE